MLKTIDDHNMTQKIDWIFYGLGVFYFRHNEFDSASSAFLRVLQINLSHDGAYRHLSIICREKGQREKAHYYIKKALK